MTEANEYVLGTELAELDRLRSQHVAWIRQAYALFERMELRTGQSVVDLGCGPGFTTLEIAQVVGPTGRVVARDVSPRFIDFLRRECERLALAHVEPSLGPVEELSLPAESVDAAYARWLLCWLPDPGAVLARVADMVRPGGTIGFQDYLDWAAMKLVPRSEIHDRAVLACMQSWEAAGATIDIGEQLPELAERCGLTVSSFHPVARIGPVGSHEWRWVGGFFANYLPKLVEQGLFEPEELEAFREEWQELTERETSRVYTPTMVDVVLRR